MVISKHHNYVKTAIQNLNSGIETIYILADSSVKSQFAVEVAQMVEEKDIRIKKTAVYRYKRKRFDGIKTKGVCIALHTLDVDEILGDA